MHICLLLTSFDQTGFNYIIACYKVIFFFLMKLFSVFESSPVWMFTIKEASFQKYPFVCPLEKI